MRTFAVTNHGMKNLGSDMFGNGVARDPSREAQAYTAIEHLESTIAALDSNCEKNTMAIALSTNLLAFVD